MSSTSRWKELILPVGILASVLVILVPLPSALIDVLLAANITLALIVVLTAVYVKTPLEFSIFPSLLLATTLGRLVLNIATTRLILKHAPTEQLWAAGGVIKAFGEFVAAGDIVIGVILFSIIVAIQFIVITKGASRISEVAARFTLDGLPGRQLAIDADVNAGLIDHTEALRRRSELTRQADFFGAMDGASKFVRGDAIAGIIITLVNIVGGLIVGVFGAKMSISAAAAIFTKLTIGDGLASQIPAFLIALAAGLIVTRTTSASNLPRQFVDQLFSRPEALAVAGIFAGLLVFTQLPALPLLTIGGGCLGLAIVLSRQAQEQAANKLKQEQSRKKPSPQPRVEDLLAVDPIECEIGIGIVRLADPNRGGDLLDRVRQVRQELARSVGLLLPKVRIRDNLRLNENAYRIKIANNTVADGTIDPARMLATAPVDFPAGLAGDRFVHPATGETAMWIDESQQQRAQAHGCVVTQPAKVMCDHLLDIAEQHADELLTRDVTRKLIDELKTTAPEVVDELIPNLLTIGQVQQVLRLLLAERVPIRQLAVILETLADQASRTGSPEELVEFVRQRLARTICQQYRDLDKVLSVIQLDEVLEADLVPVDSEPARAADASGWTRIDLASESRSSQTTLVNRIATKVAEHTTLERPAVLLVHPRVRQSLRRRLAALESHPVVLSYGEISTDTQVKVVTTISKHALAA